MIFEPAPLPGLVVVHSEPHRDARGFFARAWCREEFARNGLDMGVVQANIAFNERAGTLRGLHYQSGAGAEKKLVRCIRGRIFDVAVDVRPDSPTYLRHYCRELDPDEGAAILIPEGFAHGCQALEDGSVLSYLVSAPHDPDHEHGLRYDDPELGIDWPLPPVAVSEKDLAWPWLRGASFTPPG